MLIDRLLRHLIILASEGPMKFGRAMATAIRAAEIIRENERPLGIKSRQDPPLHHMLRRWKDDNIIDAGIPIGANFLAGPFPADGQNWQFRAKPRAVQPDKTNNFQAILDWQVFLGNNKIHLLDLL